MGSFGIWVVEGVGFRYNRDMNREDFPLILAGGSVKADCCLDPRDVGAVEGLIYFDNAATMQKPRRVIEAVREFYECRNANTLRGLYGLSVGATEEVERVRGEVANFIGAEGADEIIFTAGATAGLNMAAMWGAGMSSDDEIVVGIGEHHSNLLPWVRIAEATGARLKLVKCMRDGTVDLGDYERALTPNTRVVAVNYIGNVFGGENCIKNLFREAHDRGRDVMCVLDAAQAVAHKEVNMRGLGADVMCFSGHKMGAPMGIGVMYARRKIMEGRVMPMMVGGGMVEDVAVMDDGLLVRSAKGVRGFEAGTLNVGGIVGLGVAIEYLEEVGMGRIREYEEGLTEYLMEKVGEVAEVYGGGNGMVAFNVPGVHAHDTAQILADEGVAVRAGWHCAQPLLESLGIGPVVRASTCFYNTQEEIDRMVRILGGVAGRMGRGL